MNKKLLKYELDSKNYRLQRPQSGRNDWVIIYNSETIDLEIIKITIDKI
jgi:hypothetical protein